LLSIIVFSLLSILYPNIYSVGYLDAPSVEWIFEEEICFSSYEQIDSIYPTLDGGFLLVGYIKEEGTYDSDVLVGKINSLGKLEWCKSFGGDDNEEGCNGQQTTDGGFVVFAITKSKGSGGWDAWLLKLDENGNLTNDITIGDSEDNIINEGWQTSDQGYIMIGTTPSEDGSDVWLIKIQNFDSIPLQREYDVKKYLIDSDQDIGMSIHQTNDNGYIIAGTHIRGFKEKAFMMKIFPSYSVDWIEINEGLGDYSSNHINSVCLANDGGYVAVGTQNEPGDVGDYDFWMWKLNSNGEEEIDTILNDSEANDELFCINKAHDNGFITIGARQYNYVSDLIVIKTDPNGIEEWIYIYNNNTRNDGSGIALTKDYSYIAAGKTRKDEYVPLVIKFDGINDPPTINIDRPYEGEIINGTYTIYGTADDINGYGTLKKVEIKIDEENWIIVNGTTFWSYDINTHFYNNDLHKICARSYDGELWSDSLCLNVIFENNNEITSEINLFNGWNMITIPVEKNWMASDLGQNIQGCTQVSYWNNTQNRFQNYLVDFPDPDDDFIIRPGRGYFVYVTQDSTLSITGLPLEDIHVPIGIGWNMIGWFNSDSTNASNIGSNIPGATQISYWNNTQNRFQNYLVDFPDPDDDYIVTQGMGLYVYSSEEG